MKKLFTILVIGVMLVGLSGVTNASIIPLTDESQFKGVMTTLNFEDDVINGPGMQFDSGAFIITGAAAGAAHSGAYVLLEPNPYSSGPDAQATFDLGVYEVGLWFGNDDPGYPTFTATLSAYDFSGIFMGQTSIAANHNDAHDQFLGLASNELIKSVILDYGSSSSLLYGSIDDFSYGGDPVPIPGAIWLLASGLIGLVGLRRKKLSYKL